MEKYTMKREMVKTSLAPQPIGPYSQAVMTEHLVFASGQVAINPSTGEFCGGDVEAQTRQVMANLASVLEAAGSSLNLVLKTTIFLKDFNDFTRVNSVYGSFFGDQPPARSTVEVSRLPKDAAIEIECIAVKKA